MIEFLKSLFSLETSEEKAARIEAVCHDKSVSFYPRWKLDSIRKQLSARMPRNEYEERWIARRIAAIDRAIAKTKP